MKLRTSWEGHDNNQWPQWVWQGSQSLGDSAQVMAGQLGSGGYGTWIGWDGDGGAVQDNPCVESHTIALSWSFSIGEWRGYSRAQHDLLSLIDSIVAH